MMLKMICRTRHRCPSEQVLIPVVTSYDSDSVRQRQFEIEVSDGLRSFFPIVKLCKPTEAKSQNVELDLH